MSDIKKRIFEFINYLGLSVRQFEINCGLKQSVLSSKSDNLGSDKILKIINAYPDLDLNWVFTGKNEMLKKNTSGDKCSKCEERLYTIEVQKKHIEVLEEKIESFKKEDVHPADNAKCADAI